MLTPFIPSIEHRKTAALHKQADDLVQACAGLSAGLHLHVLQEVRRITQLVNNYYSNLIESEGTHPIDIVRAMQNDFSEQQPQKSKQHLALAYAQAQDYVYHSQADFSELETIASIHSTFYNSAHILEEHLFVVDAQGNRHPIMAGQLRTHLVEVGAHLAPPVDTLTGLFAQFHQHYQLSSQDLMYQKIIKIFSAHHRFMFIHPFLDGNGRTGRLMTDGMLNQVFPNTYGLWSLSRGLARNNDAYKQWLARADQIRQGGLDGRGQRSEIALIEFNQFMISTAQDQVDYMTSMLNLSQLHSRLKNFVELSQNNVLFDTVIPIEATALIATLLVDGCVQKAQLAALMSCSERKARSVAKQLVAAGFLYDKSKFSPLTFRLPEKALPYIFPDLIPFLAKR